MHDELTKSKAEANDISTIGGHDITLFTLLGTFNIKLSPSGSDTLRRLEKESRAEPIAPHPEMSGDQSGDMNLDIDLLLVSQRISREGSGSYEPWRRKKCHMTSS